MIYQYQHFGLSEYFCKELGENFSFQGHLHHSFEFITVFEGEMNVTLNSEIYTLRQGEALLIFPNQLHSLSSESCKHMLCIFSPELVKSYNRKISGRIPQNSKFLPDKYLIDALYSLPSDSSNIAKKGILYSICAQFDKEAQYTEPLRGDDNLVYKIFDFIEENYKNDCSLEELARKTGFSYSYLSRYFKRIVGISFNAYVNQHRISNSCYLLNNSENSILQCALDSGYKSLRSFNRNFKMLLSVTPQEYRATAK